jgi:TonB family protein
MRAQYAKGDEPVYAVAEKMPEFPGGQAALRKYLIRQFEFPVAAMDAVLDGPVQVSFVVAKDGSLQNAHVVRGQHPALDEAALRLVNGMPPWTPGEQRGKAVNVLYTMPLRFSKPAGPPPARMAQAPAGP